MLEPTLLPVHRERHVLIGPDIAKKAGGPTRPPATIEDLLWNMYSVLDAFGGPLPIDQLKDAYYKHLGHKCAIERFLVVGDAGLAGTMKRIPHVVTVTNGNGVATLTPTCHPDASQMPPSSPLTWDVSKVPPTRFQPQNNFLTFYVLENDGRQNCKMLSHMGFQWMHKYVKMWQIVKRSMKKEAPKTCTWKWQHKVKHKPSKAWFSHTLPHGIAVSTFPYLLRLCAKWHPKPFEIEVCGCLWRQKLVKERFQKHTKNQHQKSKKICQNCAPKK